jgi:threonine dehydratase
MSVTLADIQAAREAIEGQVRLTPCPATLVPPTGFPGTLWLKMENLQKTGSFKARGALNRFLALTDGERARGVVTYSAGNHAQAVAYHAMQLGIPATVVMPGPTPLVKVSNTRRYGARVVLHGQTFSDARDEARRLESEEDLVMIPAFDDERVIAGQGTIGLELAEQVPDVDTVVVPIGGGGIISGIATALKALKPGVRVIGVEAENCASAVASLEVGEPVEITSSDTIADGIAVKRVGQLTFPIIRELVDEIVTVSEVEIARAILYLLERENVVVEGAGASSLAAILSGKVGVEEGDHVVAVLCGGNIDVNRVSQIIERGMVESGRLAHLRVKVRDRPGNLARLTALVGELGANVQDVHHRRGFADISVGDVEIVMALETRGTDHVDEIRAALEARGVVVEEKARGEGE